MWFFFLVINSEVSFEAESFDWSLTDFSSIVRRRALENVHPHPYEISFLSQTRESTTVLEVVVG